MALHQQASFGCCQSCLGISHPESADFWQKNASPEHISINALLLPNELVTQVFR